MISTLTPYCISAYVIQMTPAGARYLLIRRCGKYLPGTWQMISGGIEKGETASQAAVREIQEETGLVPSSFYAADAVETFYMKSTDQIALVPVFVAFVEEETVQLSPQEHDAYAWLSFEEARERLLWAEQKRVITHIHQTFIVTQPNPLLAISSLPARFRAGVYGLAFRQQQILLVKQQKGPHAGKWELPGGGFESQETAEQALRREFLEEVGMQIERMEFLQRLSATTEATDKTGEPYHFHQTGLIYRIYELHPAATAHMEHAWLPIHQLTPSHLSPFVKHILIHVLGDV